ncbi:aspartate 1-decarboxylase [Puniceicoccus vermicola]|uniref:Aspartate 1-decarboxylase n=1 Tax=Puniceicoccus vermicola TaxID=388746 RepID=A0A7X1E7C0_9BACT|nr:aspartate 1-decarboxylase [Puniceicoccus vermicola]MBC2603562.1 aspartate 1-decarboxylase [Puniceicoccus vermicola]
MRIHLMKSKILRCKVTDSALHYEGSLEIDAALMERVGLLRYEKILVGNIDNGERFETYAIPAESGSGRISLNGAAAHKGKLGDRLVIISFAEVEADEAASFKPKTITMGEDNFTVIKSTNT